VALQPPAIAGAPQSNRWATLGLRQDQAIRGTQGACGKRPAEAEERSGVVDCDERSTRMAGACKSIPKIYCSKLALVGNTRKVLLVVLGNEYY
jgi:hypothetical protein